MTITGEYTGIIIDRGNNGRIVQHGSAVIHFEASFTVGAVKIVEVTYK